MTLFEVNQAAAIIRETAHPDVNMIFGAVIDPNMADDIRITVIATGFERSGVPRRMLERTSTRTLEQRPVSFSRQSESISVNAEVQHGGESRPAAPPSVNSDDLDIPTFLRNRR
jgi:cell division protein FtsZ